MTDDEGTWVTVDGRPRGELDVSLALASEADAAVQIKRSNETEGSAAFILATRD